MDGIGRSLTQLFYVLIIAGVIVGLLIAGIIWSFVHSSEIKTKTPLKPQTIIETNTVTVNGVTTMVSDTTYIYKKE